MTTYGPEAAQDYVNKMEKLRTNAISAMNGVFRCASNLKKHRPLSAAHTIDDMKETMRMIYKNSPQSFCLAKMKAFEPTFSKQEVHVLLTLYRNHGVGELEAGIQD